VIYTKDDFRELIEISDEAFERLEIYHALLLKWQKAINIVSNNTIENAWHRHFLDSAQIVNFIGDDVKSYADLGCGGGFPGLVIAIMRPDIDTHLVESDERKCQFMRTVSRETSTPVTIYTQRIENISDAFIPDFVTARALSSLSNLLEYCMPWAENNKDLELCFMKGSRADEEISEAQKSYSFDCKTAKSITDGSAKILSISNLVRL